MLKYSDRITKLTDIQKIRILSGVANVSGKDMKNLGIPGLCLGRMKDCGRGIYPHTTSISHAWNSELWAAVGEVKAQSMIAEDVNFAIAPGAKIKLSPYRKEMTEDPYLASMISGAYMKGAADADLPVAASGYYLTESDVNWMDATPDNRIINEYIVRPYENAKRLAGAGGIVADLRIPSEAYKDSNEYLQRVIADGTEFFVCENATDDNTVALVSRGVICLNGSANALSAALRRYRQLKKLLIEGKDVTLLQIDEEMRKGTAISDGDLDIAVDRALDFLFRCQTEKKKLEISDEQKESLALRATLESTVLLKNKNAVLPLQTDKNIAIIDGFSAYGEDSIGDKCLAKLEELGFSGSSERLYDAPELKLKMRVSKLMTPCANSDVTLLLLGSGYEDEKNMHHTEKLTLPPEQLYLVEQAAKNSKKVVAVVFSEHGTDMEFTRLFDGAIFAPLPVKYSAEALAEILSGRYNPTGRLAYTLYAGTETSLRKGEIYLRDKGMKSGPFIGYRYYDTAGLKVGYPFGHGLSYTEFAYSNISVSNGTVSFSVQNCGNVAGCEVAQIYIGMENSSILRPKKELGGFVRIELDPMEKKRISIKIDIPEVFYKNGFVEERGTYTVYVGSSVSKIHLKQQLSGGNTKLEKTEERLSDYLQSHSNILNDNYTLEANYGVMKKGITNIVSGAVALALAISLAVFNITTQSSSMAIGVISGILAVGAIILFIMEYVERSRLYAEDRKKIEEANKELFAEAEEIPVLATKRIFEAEFDSVKEDRTRANQIHQVLAVAPDEDYSEYIDEKFRMEDAVAELNRFTSERGYKLGRGSAENLLASLASSRLLILNGLSSEEFNSLILLISEYFGCSVCLDNSGKGEGSNNVLVGRDSEGFVSKKNIFRALGNAAETPSKIHISAIDEISCDNVSTWLAPLMKYIRSPKRKNEIVLADDSGKKWSYNIGNNFWTVVRLADGQAVDTLPVEIVRAASVVNVSMIKCQEYENLSASHGFTSYQIEYMLARLSGKYDVPEDIWKKIDKLEKYAKDHAEYSIGNKLWLDLEKQTEALLACKMEMDEAVDIAVATRILPSVTVAVKDRLTNEDQTVLQAMEFIFGIDNVQFAKEYLASLAVREKTVEVLAADASDDTTEEEITE